MAFAQFSYVQSSSRALVYRVLLVSMIVLDLEDRVST